MRRLLNAAPSHRFQVDRGGESDQSLVRANVRRRLFTPDMLLPRGQREHKTAAFLFVVSFADKSPGNLACVFFLRRKQSDVWSTERQRHTERLSLRDDDVRAARAR